MERKYPGHCQCQGFKPENTSPYEADVNAEVKVGDKYVVTAQVSVKDKVATAYSEINIDGKKQLSAKESSMDRI